MRPQRNYSRASVLALGYGVLALGGGAAHAQESGEAANVGGLVVTAERRTQDLQTAPISAVVLDAETLEEKGVFGLTALQYAAPGIYITDYASANTFNIRGIGQSQVDVELSNGVVIYRDGVPTLTGYFQNAPYYDMASVEVLRGPQGTFVGKSAAAGAVFIRTRDPELDDGPSGNWELGAGNYDFYEGTIVANIPLSDTLALRAAYHRETRGSLFESITSNPLPGGANAGGLWQGDDDRDLDSLRIGLLWQPSESLRAVWKLDLDDLDFGSHAVTGMDPLTGALLDVDRPIVNGHHGYTDRGARSSLTINYTFPNRIELQSLSGYSTVTTTANWDINGPDPRPFGFRSHGTFTNWSQEINLSSPDDQRFRWITGLFWQNYLSFIPDFNQAGIGFDLDNGEWPDYSTPWDKDEISYALFGQGSFDLTDRLELQVGARWSHFEFDQFTNASWDLGFFGGDDNGTQLYLELNGGVPGHWQSFEEESTDWKVNLNYEVNDNQFVYGLISRGHATGGLNILGPDPFAPHDPSLDHLEFEEMSVINYELGWKGAFFERQLRFQANVYYQTFDGYQAGFAFAGPSIIGPFDTVSNFRNAQTESVLYGVEIGFQGYFGDLAIDGGFAYNFSELGDFGLVDNPFSEMPDDSIWGPDTIRMDGASTPFSPEYTANLGIAYTFHFPHSNAADGEIRMTPRIDIAYRDDAYANLFQNPATLMEGQTLLNAQLRFETGDWHVNFWGTNLTNERFAGAKQNVGADPADAYVAAPHVVGIVYAAPPRLFGVRIGRRF